ncbi:MAG: hypothetical protein KJN80_05040 [Deltaproteobacteria bacterium]|nr:hypothetical protein [Deltaproteobacteria bacterium]
MKKELDNFYFAGPDPTERAHRRKLLANKLIRKIGPRLYTSLMDDQSLEKALNYEWPLVVKRLYPDTVVSFRTALDYRPSPKGYIFLVAKMNKVVEMGHITH